MPKTERIEGVPQGELGGTVQEYADSDDAIVINCEKQPNGTWTITYTLP